MKPSEHIYAAIDLKSFYASVECVERGLDPLSAYLVVADESRTDKTICLAVSPALKAFGIPGRARLFEVKEKLRQLERQGTHIDIVIAPPRMALYMSYSKRIMDIYGSFISPDDIHQYSVDEAFLDLTSYLPVYKMTAHELTMTMIREVLRQTGITATGGIGTNMYLCKVAMDIVAKHIPADKDGVRIAELDEMSYRQTLWDHKPITAFWRVGKGIAAHLAKYGIDTMGKLARLSTTHGEWLFHEFGVNAELLIDHAWGYEPCTIADVKAYRPETSSFSHGQVLSEPYTPAKARVVILEMADNAALGLVQRRLTTDQLVLTINYDSSSLTGDYHGEIKTDYYGRSVPKHAQGTINLGGPTSSTMRIMQATGELFDRIVDKNLLIRRLTLSTNHIQSENAAPAPQQLELFAEPSTNKLQANPEREKRLQEAVLKIKNRYGKNALLKGLNFNEGATARERNLQLGGHKA